MKTRLKNLLFNLFLVFLSLVFSFIFIEKIVLKYFSPVTDIPRVIHIDGMTRYKPNQKGVYRLANEYSAPFSINKNGWNSHHKEYLVERNQKLRIAIIGDSYIAGLETGYKFAIPYLLEEGLGPDEVEVYAFGIGGAHLAQYLHIFREEVIRFNPDIVVFLIIHGDFAPSYTKVQMASGRYGGTFLTLSLLPGNSIKVVPPKPYNSFWDLLLDFRTIRFSFYQYKLRTKISYIKNFVLDRQYKMNVDAEGLRNNFNSDKIVADYVVKEIASIAEIKNINLIFAMNGDTQSIYESIPSIDPSLTLKLNAMMGEIVKNRGGDFIDLHETFKNDFEVNNIKFEFKTDGHWNPYGHMKATETILNAIKRVLKMRVSMN